MFSWTVVPVHGFDMDAFINIVMNRQLISDETLRELRAWLFRCEMRVCLREMVSIALDLLERSRTHPRALSFLVEFVAGLKYAYDDRSVGRMRELKTQFNCCTNRHAIEFLKSFCADAWKRRKWRDKNMWFLLRVRCMDAYALSHILNATAPNIIYYAGSSHTRNLEEYILQKKIGQTRSPEEDSELWSKLRELAQSRRLSHVVSFRLKKGANLLFIGEEHNRTEKEFGTELVEVLESLCSGSPVLFLIEKHITNQKDELQCELMCNQPNLALHKSRCSSFVEDGHTTCDAVEVVAVDNRHTDMGFMRVELMDLWDDDDGFRMSSEEFQQSSLLSMYNFCSTLLMCNKMRDQL